MPLVGIALMTGICLAMSTNRTAAIKRWNLFVWGFGLQFFFALFVLKTKIGETIFKGFNDFFVAVIGATQAGTEFVFGALAVGTGDKGFATAEYVQMAVKGEQPGFYPGGMVLGINVLCSIIFFSALTSILYHIGFLQIVVKGIAWVMQKTMRTSGAETLSASGNIFVGQTEAPLMVRPFIKNMTKSELMTVMTGGFATVAGGVMAAYVGLVGPHIEGIAGHLLAASVMSAPAALLFGKLMVPETETPETLDTVHVEVEKETTNLFDAATAGTTVGVQLTINVAAMLISFLALIKLVDITVFFAADMFMKTEDIPQWLNLRGIAGYVFAPFAYTMGITDWGEAVRVGQLLGVKMIANEFVAFLDMAGMLAETGPDGLPLLSERSRIICVYALCGFANFGSIGIQIGGLAVMAPERRHDLSALAFRAMLAGTFACIATGCVAAVII